LTRARHVVRYRFGRKQPGEARPKHNGRAPTPHNRRFHHLRQSLGCRRVQPDLQRPNGRSLRHPSLPFRGLLAQRYLLCWRRGMRVRKATGKRERNMAGKMAGKRRQKSWEQNIAGTRGKNGERNVAGKNCGSFFKKIIFLQCSCGPNFEGVGCTTPTTCPNGCSGNGNCISGPNGKYVRARSHIFSQCLIRKLVECASAFSDGRGSIAAPGCAPTIAMGMARATSSFRPAMGRAHAIMGGRVLVVRVCTFYLYLNFNLLFYLIYC
jgi:hypothetical protein